MDEWTSSQDERAELVDVEVDALSHRKTVVRNDTGNAEEDDGDQRKRPTAVPPTTCTSDERHSTSTCGAL